MSIHIGAEQGAIAETILLPGDPLRAKFVAENFLDNPVQYNNIRGMLGFTGTYKGKRVSVQGTGMGMPSISIYATELMQSYQVKNLIRIGTCGSLQENVRIRDVILAMSSCSNSGTNKVRFNGMDYAPTANYELFQKAVDASRALGIPFHAGTILSSDEFYTDDPDSWKLWAKFGVLAVEMETAALYTLAAKYGANALSILTVSDSLVTHEATSAEERQTTFKKMMEIALSLA